MGELAEVTYQHVADEAVSLKADTVPAEKAWASPVITLDPDTKNVTVRIARPTSANGIVWPEDVKVFVSVVLNANGVEHRADGSTSGGIRVGQNGEIGEYHFSFGLPVYLTKDGAKRIGQLFSISAKVSVTADAKDFSGTVLSVESVSAPAPTWPIKNSVAFDAASSVYEFAGDGVISVSHSATGSNLAAWAGVGNVSFPAKSSTSCTYNSTAMTSKTSSGTTNKKCETFALANSSIPTGSSTVVSTLDAAPAETHCMGVVTVTGVNQGTPCGTPQSTSTTSAGTISLTCADAADDDMILDCLFGYPGTGGNATIGADQTSRVFLDNASGDDLEISSQPGNVSGDVVSWSLSGSFIEDGYGAVAFKAAATGGGPLVGSSRLVGAGQLVNSSRLVA